MRAATAMPEVAVMAATAQTAERRPVGVGDPPGDEGAAAEAPSRPRR
jgi:hypothetical protein